MTTKLAFFLGLALLSPLTQAYPDCESAAADDLTFYPMPDCNQFYQCVGGEQFVFTCQEGLVFNYEAQACDYPENVDCDNQVDPPTEGPGGGGTEGPSEANCDDVADDDLSFYPMAECNKFYQCIGGKGHVFTCQEGLVFNWAEQVCDYPENVDCDNQKPPTEGPEGPGTEGPGPVDPEVPECQGEDDNTLYPHADCDKYYQCAHGEPQVQNCPDGLHFNEEIQNCDHPENVDC